MLPNCFVERLTIHLTFIEILACAKDCVLSIEDTTVNTTRCRPRLCGILCVTKERYTDG